MAEGARLESAYILTGIEGSNPSLSDLIQLMGKKSKSLKVKAKKLIKTTDEKIIEINRIKEEINKLGLGDGNKDIETLYEMFEEYINNDISFQGKLNILGYQRVVDYILPLYSKNKCKVHLLYDKNI